MAIMNTMDIFKKTNNGGSARFSMNEKFQAFLNACDIDVVERGILPDARLPGDHSRPDNVLYRTGKETEIRTMDCTITFGPHTCYGHHMMTHNTYYVSVHGKPFDFLVAYGMCHALKCKKNITNGKIIAYTNIYERDGSKYISFDVVNRRGLSSFMISLRMNNPEAVMVNEKKFTKIVKDFIYSNTSSST